MSQDELFVPNTVQTQLFERTYVEPVSKAILT